MKQTQKAQPTDPANIVDAASPTRTRILEMSLKLFADSGYDGTSVQDIASAVGIKAASLYAHFPGKEAIFRDVLSLALGRWAALAQECLGKAGVSDKPETGIARILHAFITAMADSTAYRFWTRVYVFPPPFMKEEDFAACAMLDKRFARGLRSACAGSMGLDGSSPGLATLSTVLTNYLMGLMVNAVLTTPTLKEIEAAVALMIHGIRIDSKRRKA